MFFNNRFSLICVHCNFLQMLCCATRNFRETERNYIFRHCHDNHRKLPETSAQKQSLKTCFGNVSFVFISHKRTLSGSVVSVFASRQKTQRNTVNRRNDRERLSLLHVSVVSGALQGHEILLKVSFSSSFQLKQNLCFCRRIIIKNSETSSYQLKTLDPKFNGAVCSSLDEVVHLNQKNFKNFTFHISNEYLKTSSVVFYFPKNSFLVKAFNENIGFLKAAGLIDFWISRHMDLRYVKLKEGLSGPKTLKILQLRGIFTIWLAGCIVGIIILFLEFARKRLTRSQ